MCTRLIKHVYKTLQAAEAWQEACNRTLVHRGFVQSLADAPHVSAPGLGTGNVSAWKRLHVAALTSSRLPWKKHELRKGSRLSLGTKDAKEGPRQVKRLLKEAGHRKTDTNTYQAVPEQLSAAFFGSVSSRHVFGGRQNE